MAIEQDYTSQGGVWSDEDRAWAWYDVSGLRHRVDGPAVIWSDGATRFYGTIYARGAVTQGDGGKVETSGKAALVVGGAPTPAR